jgi:hypothetical protein
MPLDGKAIIASLRYPSRAARTLDLDPSTLRCGGNKVGCVDRGNCSYTCSDLRLFWHHPKQVQSAAQSIHQRQGDAMLHPAKVQMRGVTRLQTTITSKGTG